jgi:hypothetical protein
MRPSDSLIWLCLLGRLSLRTGADDRPNILLVLLDDSGGRNQPLALLERWNCLAFCHEFDLETNTPSFFQKC